MEDENQSDVLRVVFMCTGNQARSVLAEHYLRKIAAGLPVTTESVGLLDTDGAPALEGAVEAGRELGLDLSSHESRHFSAVDLSDADLVIGFEQQHVAAAVVEGNAPAARTFRLSELRRLGEGTGAGGGNTVEAARAAIERVAAHRAADTRFRPGEDLTDPIGKDARFFKQTAQEIQAACDEIFGALFQARPVSEEPPLPLDASKTIWGV